MASIRESLHQMWCDVGGTFTDCFVVFPNGSRRCTKVLSSGITKGHVSQWFDSRTFFDPGRRGDPDGFWVGSEVRWLDSHGQVIEKQRCVAFEKESGRLQLEYAIAGPNIEQCRYYELDHGLQAPVLATRLILGLHPNEPLPPLDVRMGTTRGTNALLTRTGEPTVLVTTAGFADMVRIGYQDRPELFSLAVRKRRPLYERVIEATERIAADGSVLIALKRKKLEKELRAVFDSGIRSLAICLLHSYQNPVHEQAVESIAKSIGFTNVCVSSIVAPSIKAVTRAETTLVDAYLTPIVRGYLNRLSREMDIKNHRLRIMTSSGGLAGANAYHGKDSVLSGPAGGAVAVEAYAQQLAQSRAIGLDMGGTSTDVCRIDGQLQLEHETIKAGIRMSVPTLAIHTVAAGGGSVCWFDGVQLRVGPKSAGADPGPACYGRGGPLTITDLNLLANRIDSKHFPFVLDRSAAQQQLEKICQQINQSSNQKKFSCEELCHGFRRIANEYMAEAVRSISIAQGADPRTHALIGFGGAAGQHICEIADLLGIRQIIDPAQAGLLSALGMGMASVKRSFSRPLYIPLGELEAGIVTDAVQQIRKLAASQFSEEGIRLDDCEFTFFVEIRYLGTEGTLVIPISTDVTSAPDWEEWKAEFERRHRLKYGYVRIGKALEVASLKAECSYHSPFRLKDVCRMSAVESSVGARDQLLCTSYDRDDLLPGQSLIGPALISSRGSTTFLDEGWRAEVTSDLSLLITRSQTRMKAGFQFAETDSKMDPVLREVIAQRIAAIAEQMGLVLEQTAMSVNVKDRKDFSCAVFASNGDLIANAPHVPVHLGAMSETIRRILAIFPEMQHGDCFVTNDPFQGGSHLPDITVVTPVFADDSRHAAPDFFVACRAHHAEIGGIAPGSMPPRSCRLVEEGVIIQPMHLAQAGIDKSKEVENLLQTSPFPSRSVIENMADLAAQQAANQRGIAGLMDLVATYGVATTKRYLDHILEASEQKTRAWIASLTKNTKRFEDRMDDGTRICVAITPLQNLSGKTSLRIDFTGTGPVSKTNLNANPAIVASAVLYVIRCALNDTLPLNSGVLRCVDLIVPEGILNPPTDLDLEQLPAVAGGNVETSQRIVDCLLGALGLAAASQGTMNNFLFGDATFGYYETIGGGSGATAQGPGEDAVHCHMTNTRLTDVETLERRYPVRLVQFAIRSESGGEGRYPGGNGMIRQIQALRPLEVSLVTSRRNCAPFGIEGGGDGSPGANWWIRANGEWTSLGSSAQLSIEPGDSILIETPGGGGFGVD